MKPALLSTTPLRSIAASNRRTLAAIAFAAVAITVGACSSNGTSGSSSTLIPAAKAKANSTATPPPYTYTFQPVDHALNGSDDTRVTGITQNVNMILGVSGTTPTTYNSWTAHTPLPSSTGFTMFRSKDYPGAAGTYMSAITNDFYQAGTVFSPPPSGGLQCSACGVVFYSKGSGTNYGSGCGSGPCMWTFMQDPNEGTGSCAVTEVLGIAGWNMVVGYYEQGANSCGTQAFEGYYDASGAEYFADFNVPGADPNTTQATGVNEEGNAIGTAGFHGHPEGWLYVDASYCTGLAAPDSSATYPLSINWEDDIVGYYLDGDQHAHGFLLLKPTATSSNQIWETIDDPLADNYTVVSDVTTHHAITGWYKDQYNTLHGFVGTCTSSNCTKGSQGRERHSVLRGASKSRGSSCVPSGSLKWKKRL